MDLLPMTPELYEMDMIEVVTYSMFLAQLLGIYMAFMGIAFFGRMNDLPKIMDNFKQSPALVLFLSALGFVTGLLLVLTHNQWVFSWEVIVTIIGWSALLKSSLFLLFPKNMIAMTSGMYKNKVEVGLTSLSLVILGGVLIYFGFAI